MKRIALAAIALAGCGSGAYAPTGLTTAPTPRPSTPAATATRSGSAAGSVVTIKNLSFRPQTVTTHVGQAVEWVNRDDVAHTVTTLDGATISSPTLAPGSRFDYVPARPGRLRYYCTIHASTMSGVLIVLAR